SLIALMIFADRSPYSQKAKPLTPNLFEVCALIGNIAWHSRQNGLPGFTQLMHGVGKKKFKSSFTEQILKQNSESGRDF
ncbi:MAG: hypothetical protein EBZ87_04470, partial [Microbacteriaceae bacterium]|nr:hypothetical protein [Microbacteriaceae bacterium]